jgi:transposase InsO family protein
MTVKDSSPRLTRWALLLQSYNFDIVYKSGKTNQDADALSRNPIDSESYQICALTAKDISFYQQNDEFCMKLRNLIAEGNDDNFKIINNILYRSDSRRNRVVVPEALVPDIFRENHDSPLGGHQGIKRTLRRLHRSYYWQGMDEDVKERIRNCITCANVKSPRRTFYEPHGTDVVLEKPFQRIALDTFGPLPLSNSGNKYIFVAQDMFCRYAFAKATAANNTDSLAAFLQEVILTTSSVPESILSDNGAPYSSTLTRILCLKLGINQNFSPAYHPESNGLVERFMSTIKNMIMSYTSENQTDWDEKIAHVLFAYNTTPHSETNETPFFLVFGRDPRLPTDMSTFTNILEEPTTDVSKYKTELTRNLTSAYKFVGHFNQQAKDRNKNILSEKRKNVPFSIGDLVWHKQHVVSNAAKGIAAKLIKLWKGPYRVIDKRDAVFDLKSLDSKVQLTNVHAQLLKAYLGTDPESIDDEAS